MKTYTIQESIIIAIGIDADSEEKAYEIADKQISDTLKHLDYHDHNKSNLAIIDIRVIK